MKENHPQFFEYSAGGSRKIRIAWYDSGGSGENILLLHGFAGCAGSWNPLLDALPPGSRYYRLDLKGFGYSADELGDNRFSPYDQAEIVREFIRFRRIDRLTLIGHSLGATTALIAASDAYVAQRLDRLIVLAPVGMERSLPDRLAALVGSSPGHNPLLRKVDPDLTAFLVLSPFVAQPELLSDQVIHTQAKALAQPGAIANLITAARQLFIPDRLDFESKLLQIKVPTLIVWGKSDHISSPDNAALFHHAVPGSKVKLLSDCGNLPHIEQPAATAALITAFPEKFEFPVVVDDPAPTGKFIGTAKLKLRRLIDHWSIGTLGFVIFLKFLQLLRKCGVKAEENGWRKATGIFMRNEYSKFILSCFRLRYYRSAMPPADQTQAKQELIGHLAKFLNEQSSFHWSAEPGFFILGRRKTFFRDIVVANYTLDGHLESLEPHFDDARENFSILSEAEIDSALKAVVTGYNRFARLAGLRRANAMKRYLHNCANRAPGCGYAARTALRLLFDRLMTATYLHCEVLPEGSHALPTRLRTPNLKKYRHPGWGLLNIFCRFTADFREADLWVQFHHVPVDGAPMQELLEKLKNEWGRLGQIQFPAVGSPAARPEIFHCGDRLFRAKFYISFDRILALRSELNARYRTEMGGPATVAGMILWGLSRHPYFAKRKMLFPVDSTVPDRNSHERELSLVFIRPGKFDTPEKPLRGFLKFQKSFNQMILTARGNHSESVEFLDLCSMVHPLGYHVANYLLPDALREIVGTVGVSIIRDAEMFISPLSDFQTAGFMAIGDMAIPTEDGGRAGAVSICASRTQIRYYIKAMTAMANHYHEYLGRSEPLSSSSKLK